MKRNIQLTCDLLICFFRVCYKRRVRGPRMGSCSPRCMERVTRRAAAERWASRHRSPNVKVSPGRVPTRKIGPTTTNPPWPSPDLRKTSGRIDILLLWVLMSNVLDGAGTRGWFKVLQLWRLKRGKSGQYRLTWGILPFQNLKIQFILQRIGLIQYWVLPIYFHLISKLRGVVHSQIGYTDFKFSKKSLDLLDFF